MMSHRAYILLLPLLAVLASASCSKHDAHEESAERVPILFSCSPVSVDTRAGNTFISNNRLLPRANDYFYVYGWNTGSSYLSAAPGAANFFNPALKVQFVDNDNQGSHNTYGLTTLRQPMDQYWPQDGTPYAYSFFAYYPYDDLASTHGISEPDFSTPPANGKFATIDFVAKKDAVGNTAVDDMVDFCVSDVANDQTYGNTTSAYPGTVDFTFHHMLTLVQIKFVKSRDVAEDVVIELLDARLDNINSEGTLTLAYTPPVSQGPGVDGATDFHWINVDTPVPYEITVGGVNPEYDSGTGTATNPIELGYTQSLDIQDAFLMIPQHLWTSGNPNRQRIHFWWRADGGEVQETEDTYLSDSKRSIGSDDTSGISDWRINQMVTYTVVIRTAALDFGTNDDPEVTVDIAPWPTQDVNGYIQIID